MQNNNFETIKKLIPNNLILINISDKDFKSMAKNINMIKEKKNKKIVLYCDNKNMIELNGFKHFKVILFYGEEEIAFPQVLIDNENALKLNIEKFFQHDEECVICYEKEEACRCNNCGCNICKKCMNNLIFLENMVVYYKCPLCRNNCILSRIIQ